MPWIEDCFFLAGNGKYIRKPIFYNDKLVFSEESIVYMSAEPNSLVMLFRLTYNINSSRSILYCNSGCCCCCCCSSPPLFPLRSSCRNCHLPSCSSLFFAIRPIVNLCLNKNKRKKRKREPSSPTYCLLEPLRRFYCL